MSPICSHPRVNSPSPGDINFIILVEGFLVYITMNSVFLQMCKNREEVFLKNGQLLTMYALPLGDKSHEIHNLCSSKP